MKRTLLLATSILTITAAQAQHATHSAPVTRPVVTAAKPTATGDTLTLTNIPATQTERLLYPVAPAGSGYTTGTNVYNDKGFAERYYFDAGDSSVNVLGVVALFGGNVSATSTKSVMLRIWSQTAPKPITARLYYEGFPFETLDSLSVPATKLGIGPTADTLKAFMFATPTGFLKGPFFAGYTIDYNFETLGPDTIALKTSKHNTRNTAPYRLRYNMANADTVSVDTLINVQNATLWADNKWHDNYTDNDSLYNDLAIFPIVVVGGPTGTGRVTHKDLSLMGAYPNPSTGTANIRFALAEGADVSITIMDMAGHTVYTRQLSDLRAGEHTVQVSTAGYAAGTYIYLVRTATGSGMAGKMQVAH
ncbi:hypothetical protein GCM10023093_11820 [Nemorincola caseinilytica]|uniref:Secretion system C-terminal sorting domain-containing protein n=1 Tax=Nemorincola caseinilytica TaxID=2054315 RepID=A0ABP8N9E3_9BACT